MSFPIIDVSEIDNPDRQLAIAKEVTDACKQWGFLLIKGHTIPAEDIKEMFALAKEFFYLPEDQKEPWAINSRNTGYIGSFKDRSKDDKASMWFGGVPGELEADKTQLPPFWHDKTEKVQGFKHKCHGMLIKLLVCFALALDLPDRNFFANAHLEDVGKGHSFRMLMYPGRKEMPHMTQGSRMQPHTDSGSVTLLFQQAAGLEVLSPTGEWVKAPCIDDCILVNLGDSLSFWSGTQLKATLHRVTFDGLPYDQERQSMAYFGAANPDTVLQPLTAGQKMSTYNSNGIVVEPGITAGQLSNLIMTSIYGGGEKKSNEVAVAG